MGIFYYFTIPLHQSNKTLEGKVSMPVKKAVMFVKRTVDYDALREEVAYL